MRKAYLVYGGALDGEAPASIVFAKTPGQAKCKSEAYGEYDFTELHAIRKPQFDIYADKGDVPQKDLLADGWWFEEKCAVCGKYRIVSQGPLEDGEINVEFNKAGNIVRFYCQDCACLPKEAAPHAD